MDKFWLNVAHLLPKKLVYWVVTMAIAKYSEKYPKEQMIPDNFSKLMDIYD